MNSWPSTLVSPLDLCSSVIQWCISSGVSALQWSTRLAVMITNELGLRRVRKKGSLLDPGLASPDCTKASRPLPWCRGPWETLGCYLQFILRQTLLIFLWHLFYASLTVKLGATHSSRSPVLRGKISLPLDFPKKLVPRRQNKVTMFFFFFKCISKTNFFLPLDIALDSISVVENEIPDSGNGGGLASRCRWNILRP